MKLLWVAAPKVGSQMIRWATDSECSHFAVCFDEGEGEEATSGTVFHSHGSGTQIEWLKSFCEHYQIVHALAPAKSLTLEDEETCYQAVLGEDANREYDYPAIGWWAWRALLKKVFGIPLNKTNNWQSDKKRLCTGIMPAVCRALGVKIADVDTEMVSPHDLYQIALDSGHFVVATDWVRAANEV